MANYSINLNLLDLKGAKVMEIQGHMLRTCVVIPIDNNTGVLTDGYKKSTGEWVAQDPVLHLSAIEMRQPKKWSTHFIKPCVNVEAFQNMTEEQVRAIPIVGSMKPYGQQAVEDLPEETAQEGW